MRDVPLNTVTGGRYRGYLASNIAFEAQIATDELATRGTRPANYAAENQALAGLMDALSRSSHEVLQRLVEIALELCQAHSAGISVLPEPHSTHFEWRAVAGEWAPYVSGTIPRGVSASGVVLERRAPLLLSQPHLYFAIPETMMPPVSEVLLAPFYVSKEPVGTLWVVAHDGDRKFDREDLRLLTSLGRVAGNAYQLLRAHESERLATARLQAKTAEAERLAENSVIGLTRLGRDLRYRSVNRAYAELLRLPRERIIGRSMLDVMGKAVFAAARPHVERVLRGESVEYEVELPFRNGLRFMHVNYAPDVDAQGHVVGWIASIMDITARKLAERRALRNERQREALYRLSERLQHATSLADVYEASLASIVAAVGCDRASILLFDATGVMRFVAWLGLSEAYRCAVEGHSPWSATAREPQPVIIDAVDTAELDPALKHAVETEGIGALAFIPLVVNGQLIGKLMAYWNAPHAVSDDELEVSVTIAHQLAFAVDRQRTEEQLRSQASQLALITNTVPTIIAYCDAQARFKFVNKGYAERLGLTPEQCIGKRIDEVIGVRAYESLRPYVEQVLSGTPVEFEVIVPYAALGERCMRCAYAPQLDDQGRVEAFVAAISDVTESRRAQEELRSSEEKLREADRRKDEFLAMLAHELRNPLAPIAHAVQLLRAEAGTPRQQQVRDIIDRQTTRMARLVDDLLEVSRISSGRIQLQLQELALGAVVERAVETVRPLVERQRHVLQVTLAPEPIWVRGDPARLEQVLVNLLNNAAKYTDVGGRLHVGLSREQNHAVLRVIDNGIGIEPDLLPRVFELFTQAERSLDRAHGGLGLGLSLVQRLVAMHGGTVEAKSAIGRGSEFIVRLPALAVHARDDTSSSAASSSAMACSLQVLVVDDNVDAAASLSMLLEASGHCVRTTHSGTAALAAARELQPDIVFLDIGLPELDGYEVALRLRRMPVTRPMVIVAMTGYGQDKDRRRSREVGIDHHLVKPMDFSRVEQILARAAEMSAGSATANSR